VRVRNCKIAPKYFNFGAAVWFEGAMSSLVLAFK